MEVFKSALLFCVVVAVIPPLSGRQQRENREITNKTVKVTSPNVAVNWSSVGQYFECYKNRSALNNVPLCLGFMSGVTIGVALIILSVILANVCIGCCVYKKCCKKRSYKVMVVRTVKARIKEEETERANARLATKYYLDLASQRSNSLRLSRIDYKMDSDMNDMGSRMQKYWYSASQRGSSDGHQEAVVSNTPLPRHCPLLKLNKQTGERNLEQERISELEDLVKTLSEHPFLHPIKEIGYLEDRKQVLIIYPFMPQGSLKDMIYQVPPNQDWADKYSNLRSDGPIEDEPSTNSDNEDSDNEDSDNGRRPSHAQSSSLIKFNFCLKSPVDDGGVLDEDKLQNEPQTGCNGYCCFRGQGSGSQYIPVPTSEPEATSPHLLDPEPIPAVAGPCPTPKLPTPTGLPVDDIAKYGWQILKAMVFLYKKGFPVLGNVHSGNIFVSEDGAVCRLGGYENTLLGYRSRFYRMCKDHLDHMDVIMFGHLVFEMSCGYELITEFPTEEDYQKVRARDSGLKEVLKYIFTDGYPHSIEDIKMHGFFQSAKTEKLLSRKFRATQFLKRLIPDFNTRKMLSAVRKGQNDAANKHVQPRQRRPSVVEAPREENGLSSPVEDLV